MSVFQSITGLNGLINSQLQNEIIISRFKVFSSPVSGYVAIGLVIKSLYFFELTFIYRKFYRKILILNCHFKKFKN